MKPEVTLIVGIQIQTCDGGALSSVKDLPQDIGQVDSFTASLHVDSDYNGFRT